MRKSWKWLSNGNDKIALMMSSNNRCSDAFKFRSTLERTAWVQQGGGCREREACFLGVNSAQCPESYTLMEVSMVAESIFVPLSDLRRPWSPERQWLHPICIARVIWSRGFHFGFQQVRPTFLYLHILLQANWAPDSWASVSCTSGPLHIPALIAWWLPGALEDVAVAPLRSFSSPYS